MDPNNPEMITLAEMEKMRADVRAAVAAHIALRILGRGEARINPLLPKRVQHIIRMVRQQFDGDYPGGIVRGDPVKVTQTYCRRVEALYNDETTAQFGLTAVEAPRADLF